MGQFDQTSSEMSLRAVFGEAFHFYKQYFPFFFALGMIHGCVYFINGYAIDLLRLRAGSIIFLSTLVVTTFASICLILLSSDIYRGLHPPNWRDIILKSKDVFIKVLTVEIGYFFIVTFGFLLIFPGFYFATVFLFADFVVVLEGREFTEAYKRSFQLVKKHFWEVFFFIILLFLFMGLPLLIINVIVPYNLFIGKIINMAFIVLLPPFRHIAQVCLYYHITAELERKAELL